MLMGIISLKAALENWTDIDAAEMSLAISLGLMAPETNYQVNAKYVFNSNNPIGNMLHDTLVSLVRLGILEEREAEHDHQYRWDPLFHGLWKEGMIKFEYKEFWDVPRLFIVRLDDTVWLFDCRFAESLDEYPDTYKVYSIVTGNFVAENWNSISEQGQFLGEIKVSDVQFDPTRRKEVNINFRWSMRWSNSSR